MSDFATRLRQMIGAQKPYSWAKDIGIPGSSFDRMWNDGTPPRWNFLVLISEKTGISIDWLLTGEGPMRPEEITGQPIIHESSQEEWTMVPQYGDRLSAGAGSYVENGNEVVGHFAFKPKWLKRKCLSGKCAVFHVAGDSMYPIIQDGDVVLVDMGQNDPKEVRDGKIYAFSEGDLIRVKRLSWEGQALWSISDNKQVSPDRAIDMNIFSLIGRVIWVGHEVW